jgi:hypothetical protein
MGAELIVQQEVGRFGPRTLLDDQPDRSEAPRPRS